MKECCSDFIMLIWITLRQIKRFRQDQIVQNEIYVSGFPIVAFRFGLKVRTSCNRPSPSVKNLITLSTACRASVPFLLPIETSSRIIGASKTSAKVRLVSATLPTLLSTPPMRWEPRFETQISEEFPCYTAPKRLLLPMDMPCNKRLRSKGLRNEESGQQKQPYDQIVSL